MHVEAGTAIKIEDGSHELKETYWVPAKAKKRKEMVPTNSPMTATVCPRVVGGSTRRSRRRGPSTGAVVGASVFMAVEVFYRG